MRATRAVVAPKSFPVSMNDKAAAAPAKRVIATVITIRFPIRPFDRLANPVATIIIDINAERAPTAVIPLIKFSVLTIPRRTEMPKARVQIVYIGRKNGFASPLPGTAYIPTTASSKTSNIADLQASVSASAGMKKVYSLIADGLSAVSVMPTINITIRGRKSSISNSWRNSRNTSTAPINFSAA